MLISKVIDSIKKYYKGDVNGVAIDPNTTRDKILYGNVNQECSGIVTCIWPSIDIIKTAIERKSNLIISHEALFWNHGDHQEWLIESNNKTYNQKKELLDRYNIVVWRNHDYIHSGIPMNGIYVDGIFYGVANKLGWNDYVIGNINSPQYFNIPELTVNELAKHVIDSFNLNGLRIYGNPNVLVRKIAIPYHVFGNANEAIMKMDKGEIDCFLTMEIVDFTLAEYVKDSTMLDHNKAIIGVGHFNLEEYGMEYMLNYIDDAIGEKIPASFASTGDMYNFVIKEN